MLDTPGPRERLLANLSRRNIPGLDGLRGLAAHCVVAYHSWSRLFPGRMAVQVFFVISGLLITRLLLQEEKRSGRVDRVAFYIRRASRLFPALLILLTWEWFTDFPHAPKAGIIASALYYANYYLMSGTTLAGISQTWSLAVEEHFYLIWPHVLAVVKNFKVLTYSCFVGAAVEVVWRIISTDRVGYLYATFATETSSSAVLCGCGLGLLLWHSPDKLPAFILRPSIGIISLAVIILLAQLPEYSQSVWGLSAVIPFASIIVLQAITYEWRVLENVVSRFLGRLSYGIYLWGFVAAAIVQWFGHSVKHVLMFLVVILLAMVSYYVIERPVQNLARRWLADRAGRGIMAVGAHA